MSLAGDVNTERSADNGQPYEHVMTSAGPGGAGDSLAVSFHGYAHTHIDAFAHRFFDGKMWNGFSLRGSDARRTVRRRTRSTTSTTASSRVAC